MKLSLTPALRVVASVTLAASMAVTLAATSRADDDTTFDGPRRPGKRIAHGILGNTDATAPNLPQSRVSAAASSEELNAQARLNDYRARAGLPAITVAPTPGALLNHARYMDLNYDDPTLDPYSEEPGLPGYTENGNAIAYATETVAASTGTFSSAIDLLMSDPVVQYFNALNPAVTKVAFARAGKVITVWFSTSEDAPAGKYPAIMPNGARFGQLKMPNSVASRITQGCDPASSAWGFPITVQWDPDAYTETRTTSATLQVNGASVKFCIASDTSYLGTSAQVVLVPNAPLPAGAHVTGSVEANLTTAGDDPQVESKSATINFTTASGPSKGPGDQNGDGLADLLAVRDDGSLWMYLGRSNLTFGHGWQIGRGWQSFTWFSHIADVNGDGREDMIGRRDDGNLYLYTGLGMGGFSAARQIGKNWNGLDHLTVIGDVTGDKQPEIVGIGNSGANKGKLFRYTLTPNGLTGQTTIGQNWGGISHTIGIGDFDGNGTGDLLAVTTDGRLFAYLTSKGLITRTVQVGHGWQGYDKVFTPGDLNGDLLPDLVARDAKGNLYSYANRRGSFGPQVLSGTGFGGMRLFG